MAFGAYEGDSISSVAVGGPDQETNLIDVTIECWMRGSESPSLGVPATMLPSSFLAGNPCTRPHANAYAETTSKAKK